MWHQRAAPIIRGSNGQGKSYQTLIRPDFDGHDLKDLEAAGTYSHGPAGSIRATLVSLMDLLAACHAYPRQTPA